MVAVHSSWDLRHSGFTCPSPSPAPRAFRAVCRADRILPVLYLWPSGSRMPALARKGIVFEIDQVLGDQAVFQICAALQVLHHRFH